MEIWGCDVGAKFIILHNGRQAFKVENPQEVSQIIKPSAVVVLEQTGAYGVRWAEIFTSLGAKVYIADGRDFKNFRMAHSRKKDDRLDAFYLRKYYAEKPHKCRPYNPLQVHIRALIRQHIRNEKDITKHVNRLRQYLAVIFPLRDFYKLNRSKFFKLLPTLEEELKQTPHALSELALSELRKLKIVLEENQRLEEEIVSIARNHPDYEILKTFPIGDLQIATLLAYSWDISTFPNKDGYLAYVLMGANLEQSGVSVYKVKTDKARTEVKGIFYMLYLLAHRKTAKWTHPLNPLVNLVKDLVNARHNYKKRYIKFLSRFLELTYYARKYRLSYTETLNLKLQRLQKELYHLKEKEPTETKTFKAYRLTKAITTFKELIKLAPQGKDIPEPPKEGAGRQVYLRGAKNEEKEINRNGTFKPRMGGTEPKIPGGGDIQANHKEGNKNLSPNPGAGGNGREPGKFP